MLAQIVHFLKDQPMLTGLVGATFAGGAMFLLRQLPAKLFALLRSVLTVTLVIEQRDEAFGFVTGWLAGHAAVARARQLMLTEAYDNGQRRWNTVVTLGRGWHLLRHAGAWLLVNREVKDAEGLAAAIGAGNNQRLWLMSIGPSQVAVRSLIAHARAHYYGGGLINVHFWHDGGWLCADRRPPRPLETVFMPPAQKAGVLADVRQFLASRDLYGQRGVPWRRGYLFKGPPGTGKTTLIFALASALARPVYSLNLSNVRSDNELLAAFNSAETDGVVVIEDIDANAITRDRDLVAQGPASAAGELLGGDGDVSLHIPSTQGSVVNERAR